MTKKEASFILANIDRRVCDDELSEALDIAIKTLEQNSKYRKEARRWKRKVLGQEPCEDAISRQAGIEGLTELINNLKGVQGDMGSAVNAARELIKSLPPVTPQPKTGHWIIEKWNNKEHYSCSSCQHVVDYEPCYHYCPYCGAKMEEELQWFDIA